MGSVFRVSDESARGESSLRRFLVHGAIWSAGGRMLSMVGQLVLGMVLARALSPADYGRFYLALGTVVIFAAVASLGMDQVVIRTIAASRVSNGVGAVLRRCLVVVACGAFSAAALALAVNSLFPVERYFGSADVALLVLAWAVIGTIQMQLAETYRALGNVKLANIFGGIRSSGILNALIPPVAASLLWLSGVLNLWLAIVVMLLSGLLISCLAMIRIWRGEGSSDASGSPTVTALLGSGLPLWLASMATVIYSQGFLWVASAVEDGRGLALLASAQRTVLVLIAPIAVVSAVLPPVIARLWVSGDVSKLQRTVQVVSAFASCASLAVLAGVVAGGPRLLEVLFGAFFRDAFAALLILCVANLFDVATGSWQLVLAMTGNGRVLLAISLCGVLLFLLLTSIFGAIPVVGVPSAWAVATIVMNVVGTVIARKRTGAWTFARVTRADARRVYVRVVGRKRVGSTAV